MVSERNKLAEIIRIDSELNKIQDVDILLERILLEARRSVNADAGTIYIRDEKKLVMRYSQNSSKQKELPPGQKLIYSTFRVPINKKTISGYVAATGEMINIDDVYKISGDAPYSFNPSYDKKSGYLTQSTLTIPLVIRPFFGLAATPVFKSIYPGYPLPSQFSWCDRATSAATSSNSDCLSIKSRAPR